MSRKDNQKRKSLNFLVIAMAVGMIGSVLISFGIARKEVNLVWIGTINVWIILFLSWFVFKNLIALLLEEKRK